MSPYIDDALREESRYSWNAIAVQKSFYFDINTTNLDRAWGVISNTYKSSHE